MGGEVERVTKAGGSLGLNSASVRMSEESLLLTDATVSSYVAERASVIDQISPHSPLTATPIGGGNLNFAWRVSDTAGKSVFVKQAPNYVAFLGPGGMPLASSRMLLEVAVFEEWKEILGQAAAARFLPEIYFFDNVNMVFVMEYLDTYMLLDRKMVHGQSGGLEVAVAEALGEFMGLAHAASHCSLVSPQRVKELETAFENRAMRDIQLDFVFTKAYQDPASGLRTDDAFRGEVEKLKAAYRGEILESRVLCHGDLHPGSVMVESSGAVKIIDPEFAIYGPPGLDVGSLLSGIVLAAVFHCFSGAPGVVRSLRASASALWDTYTATLRAGGLSAAAIAAIGVEAVGFAAAEVARTALGFAGGRVWLDFEDARVKSRAVDAALGVVNHCMTGRHDRGIQELLGALERLEAMDEPPCRR